jgi:DNA-binding GntR family transcriptional regulator
MRSNDDRGSGLKLRLERFRKRAMGADDNAADAAEPADGGKPAAVRQDVLDAVLLARIEPGSVISREQFAARSRALPGETDAALAALSQMGFVTVDDGAVRVKPCDVRDVLSHVERRRDLEIMIARKAALNATDKQLQEMLASEALQKRCALVGDMDGLMTAERNLEALLVEASGMLCEGEELRRIKHEFRRAWCAANRLKTFTHVANIRTALVAAVAARDPDGAEAQIRIFFNHLLRGY